MAHCLLLCTATYGELAVLYLLHLQDSTSRSPGSGFAGSPLVRPPAPSSCCVLCAANLQFRALFYNNSLRASPAIYPMRSIAALILTDRITTHSDRCGNTGSCAPRPEQNGRNFANDIFKGIFLKEKWLCFY